MTSRDGRVPELVFLAIASILAAMTIVYAISASERAGTVMLALAACLALVVGTYLMRQRSTAPPPDTARESDEGYLPDASVWPFGIGLAGFLLVNGLVLGTWFLVPGALLLVGSITGFARQSRHRA